MAEVPVQRGGQPLKYTLTHYRRPQHTHEAFIKWIVEEHLPIAMPIFKKHGILGYSLFATPPSLNGVLKQELETPRPTWDVADFDCVIKFQESIKDQDEWVDTTKSLNSLGYSTPYLLETGEVVNMQK